MLFMSPSIGKKQSAYVKTKLQISCENKVADQLCTADQHLFHYTDSLIPLLLIYTEFLLHLETTLFVVIMMWLIYLMSPQND